MLSKNIKFQNFKKIKIQNSLKLIYYKLINQKNEKKNLINTFTNSYVYSYDRKLLKKYKKFKTYNIYGMGGSSLGAQAIYDFMSFKINKKFNFFNNLEKKNELKKTKNKSLSIIISKSGNTLETIVNDNIFPNKNRLYLTENNNNYLRNLALNLK